jgi:xylose isomerase
MSTHTEYRFSFGPWNISEGADPFGPEVRKPGAFEAKLDLYQPLGFEGVQLHDDDVVEDIDSLAPGQVLKRAAEVKVLLDDRGLTPEFVAPRLWFAPQTVDGGVTANAESDRNYALDRCKQAIDIAREVGTKNIVMWYAREGSYCRESKNAKVAYERILAGLNAMLDYDKEIEIWIEPKPNEPTDQAYVPTIGHAVALAYASSDPGRVKGLIESAHAILAGLDPGDEMAFALAHGKLGSVHLNDQNGLKYDQDKNFGAANLRGAFNQVRVLEQNGYGQNGEFIGLDVKAMRTQQGELVTRHLETSREIFLALVEKARTVDPAKEQAYIEARDYEGLERYLLRHLMGLG